MSVLIKICLLSPLFVVLCEAKLRKEVFMSVPSLIKAAGYPAESYNVTTQDGYVVQLYRIPAGRRSVSRTEESTNKSKRAILLMHGLMGEASNFIIMGPDRSLAYLLADDGYDVWLGNMRGTQYTAHTNLTRNDPKFWEFSFHETGKYDLPAIVDKVLNITGLQKIMYVGHSMGTTTFVTMMALKPEYNDKIIASVLLAPAVYCDNDRQIAFLALKTLNLSNLLRAQGIVVLEQWVMQTFVNALCHLDEPNMNFCMSIVSAIIGEDEAQNDWDMLPIIINRLQAAPLRHLEHYGKVAITGVFTKYSGGLDGPVKPYNLTNVRTPILLLYGENDQLTEKYQILRLADALRSNGALAGVRPACDCPKFNHIDFVTAKDLATLLNKPLVKDINDLYNKYYGV